MTDSSTAGYLAPGPPLTLPLQGKPLYNFVGAIIAGVTGLTSSMIRPAFQSEPPVVPDAGTVWVAFSIDERRTRAFTYEQHVPASGNVSGYSYVRQQEEFEVTARVYGLGVDGGADGVASALRDGLMVDQNREALSVAGWSLVDAPGPIRPVPSLDATRWSYRLDVPIRFRRELDVSYPVLDVTSFQGTLYTDVADSRGRTFNETVSVTGP